MNTSQLQCIISCDSVLKERVVGVFAADQLPKSLPFLPCGLIVNTDMISHPGRHWLSFFICRDTVECFDSYGQPVSDYNPLFMRWIRRHGLRVIENRTRLQSDTSNVCGLYCIYFLRQRLLGYTMPEIVQNFSDSDFRTNDTYILDMFTRIYSQCVQNDCVNNQTCQPLLQRM